MQASAGPISKEEKWKEFCATSDQVPWGSPYRAVRAKMDRNVPPEGLYKDRVARILEDLFIINRAEQSEEDHSSRVRQMRGEEEHLLTAVAVVVEGVPREIVRIVAEQRPGRLLDLFNSINRSERIPAVWKVARVVLLPKPLAKVDR